VKSIRRWEQFPIDQQIDGPRFVPNREAGMSLPPTTRTPLRITTIPYTLDTGVTREGREGEGKVLALAFSDGESLYSNIRAARFRASKHLAG